MATQQKRRVRTLRDRLSHLNFRRPASCWGPHAKRLMRRSEKLLQHVEIERDVYLRGDLFRLTLPQRGRAAGRVGACHDHAQERSVAAAVLQLRLL